MTTPEKNGALSLFGEARTLRFLPCGRRTVNEMFSDFKMHVAAIPQIAPFFGLHEGNKIVDGPGEDDGFALEQVMCNIDKRYKFRTSPIRNAALQPAFFHNEAFIRLEAPSVTTCLASPCSYNPVNSCVDRDLRSRLWSIEPMLAATGSCAGQQRFGSFF